MIKIGINGFGRIGKSILNQSIVNNKIKVNAINFPGFNIHKIASYIRKKKKNELLNLIYEKSILYL